MKLTIVFADAEIEKAPEDGEIPLLDAYFYPNVEGRRGRPDIVHNALTILRSSLLWNHIDVAVCTEHGEIIIPEKNTFVQNYLDFTSQVSSLLSGGESEGYKLTRMNLSDFIHSLHADKIVALSPDGDKISLRNEIQTDGHTVLIIGAFSDGDYSSPVYELCDSSVSIDDHILTVPEVIMYVLHELNF